MVGISDVAHETIDSGERSLERSLLLLALVSLSLGLVNLIPILPLDGGHIFWALIEKLRGAPVSLRVMERATAVGIALVVMLFFLGLSNDIGRITGRRLLRPLISAAARRNRSGPGRDRRLPSRPGP